MVKVLDKGFVNLEDFMGGDLRVVNSAKVSFSKHSTEMGDSEKGLINYLMAHRHGSPFEHSYFTFRVKAPIFVVREWQRHRIGSFNEMSGRYVEFEPEFYIPERLRVPAATNKQGSVPPDDKFLQNFRDDNYGYDWHDEMSYEMNAVFQGCYETYEKLIDEGVAKEMARMVLPLSLYTEFYWTVNARSLMNFMNLRISENAQWEIRQYAVELKDFFKGLMPVTHDAWVKNGYLAP